MADPGGANHLAKDKLYIWSCGLLEFGLFNLGCDPFAVPSSHSTRGEEQNKECANRRRVFANYFDKLRRKWSKLILVVIVYMCCKCIFAMVFRGLISLAKSHRHLSVQHYLERLSWFIGDPYSSASLATCSTLLSLGNPIICLHSRCTLAYQFAHGQPLDSSFVRFSLDPKREITRIDADTSKRVEETIAALAKYRLDLSDVIHVYRQFESTLGKCSDSTAQSTIAGWQVSLERAKQQSSCLELLKSQANLIRPKAFSNEEHKRSYLMFLAFTSVFCGGAFVAVMTLEIAFHYFTWIVRCEEQPMMNDKHSARLQTNSSSICPMMDVFTWPELLTMLEMNIIPHIDLTFTYIFLFGVYLLQVYHQLRLTSNISEELDRLLYDLRTFDIQPGDSLSDERMEQLSEIDLFLYANIINLFMHERESRRNAVIFSRVLVSFAISIFIYNLIAFGVHESDTSVTGKSETGRKSDSMFILIDSIGSYQLNGDENIAIFIWLFLWIAGNLISLPCASVPSHVCRMKRTILFIMAEICRLQSTIRPRKLSLHHQHLDWPEQEAQGCPGDLGESDPLAGLWRRFVFSKDFSTDHYSASMFNLDITYKNIIELNMLVVTFISLLTSSAVSKNIQSLSP